MDNVCMYEQQAAAEEETVAFLSDIFVKLITIITDFFFFVMSSLTCSSIRTGFNHMVKLQLVTMTNNNPGYFLYISTLVLHVVDRQGRKLEHGYK